MIFFALLTMVSRNVVYRSGDSCPIKKRLERFSTVIMEVGMFLYIVREALFGFSEIPYSQEHQECGHCNRQEESGQIKRFSEDTPAESVDYTDYRVEGVPESRLLRELLGDPGA